MHKLIYAVRVVWERASRSAYIAIAVINCGKFVDRSAIRSGYRPTYIISV